ncbi:type VI secretion system PAAR protein [Enterovibrio paralichthyis]|uniref:type VI secretion system PAAR protein n=1 Tax=Enterovibrio paralichthyis TaxID=2853805 RepID=UPI000B18D4C9|nr:type VI secretion system PAAR protein [Enterovibrio paralichthyis]MBV7298324.1 type VI secretion system PAAR protein [Enterovibrio paralichthyis]
MGNAVVLGDIGTAHDGYHPSPVTSGSPNVKIDGKPVARQGDSLAPHVKPKSPPHGRSISGGSSSVFANGKPVARTGDAVGCGGVVIGGGTVNIG